MLPVHESHITCEYWHPGPWDGGHHRGTDFAAAVGTPVYAMWSGKITSYQWGSAYGLHLVIDHDQLPNGDPGYWAVYAHLSSKKVHPGQRVTAGQLIGLSGKSGNVTGPHLHVEVQTGPRWQPASAGHVTRNPQPWIDAHTGPTLYQDGKVYASKMAAGVEDSDSVRNLQVALNDRVAAGLPVTGNYLPATIEACRRFQEAQGWRGDNADGIAGPATVRRLGLTWVEDLMR
jgi:murein DD-endopeptidase MepM/ murein hydrolase activator NlpD